MSKLINIQELKPNSFVFEKHQALDVQFCQSVIERFEQNAQDHYPGRIGQQANENTDIKRSTDLVVSGKSHWQDVDRALFKSLGLAIREFRQQFPYFSGSFKDMGYGLQRTAPGEFYHWHIDGGSHEFSQRQLVGMWYLNDVVGPGGVTEFLYQQI